MKTSCNKKNKTSIMASILSFKPASTINSATASVTASATNSATASATTSTTTSATPSATNSTANSMSKSMPVSMTVSQLPYGQNACVQHVHAGGELGRRLRDMGLVSGTTLSVLSRAPLGDPLVVGMDGFNLSLRVSEADQIEVRPVNEVSVNGVSVSKVSMMEAESSKDQGAHEERIAQ